MVKLLVRASTNPVVRFEPGRVMLQVNGTVTAYAIQANGTLAPLFILNLVGGDTNRITNQLSSVLLRGRRKNNRVTSSSLLSFCTGDRCQHPGARQRDEASGRCDPQQVSHDLLKKNNQ